ncbi:hypothetical protein [Vibrio viridaestus]|nr:hypothetical protein [Vibrio viridaestus]
MKNTLVSGVLSLAFSTMCFGQSVTQPKQLIKGVLTVSTMTEGQLMWVKGRVGEGEYRYTDNKGSTCVLLVPVVVGSKENAGIHIGETKGLEILVESEKLNDALIEGQRIVSNEWQFDSSNVDPDGKIVAGIKSNEGFILNSRRRWISWLLDKQPDIRCE